MGVYGFVQVTRLLSSVIVTRLLLPEVFAIMAIALVISAGLSMFSDLGILQSIVRSKRNDRAFLDTLWTVKILRGFAIWAIALILAGILAIAQSIEWLTGNSVYAHSSLPHVVGAIGFSAVLQGFESINVAVARRQLSLSRLSKLEIICNVVAVATTISWALLDPSIWALVGGWLVAAALKAILTHVALPGYGARFQWDRSALEEVREFGKWVVVSSILAFLTASADRLVLSGLLTAHDLGIYSIAYLLVSTVQLGSLRLANQVAYPALSELVRLRPEDLRSAYYKIRLPFDVLCMGLAGFLFTVGQLVIDVLYDPRYAGAGPILAVLSLTLINARYAVAEQAFLAMGKPKLLAANNAFRMAALYLLIPLGFIQTGMKGAIWGIVAAGLLTTLVTIYFSVQNALFALRRELSCLLAFPAGFVVGLGVQWVAKSWLG